MNILTSYTTKTLKRNKTRTAVTIIGIVLSVAMFTAVTEAIVSAQHFFINTIEQTKGSYHACVPELDTDEMSAFVKEKPVKNYQRLDGVGYADVGSENTHKPYLYIASMSDGFEDMVAINLKSGRLPQNSQEIILPYHLYENGGVSYKVGDVLNLSVGKRQFEGFDLYQSSEFTEGESLAFTKEKTYKVVGLYRRFDYDIEMYTSPGYTAITKGEKEIINTDVFCTFKSVYNARTNIHELFEKYPKIISNSDLLKMYGVLGSAAIMDMIGGFATILIALIMFGSVSLIYNSFSISVSERTKQFGMLKSIGATKKQIRSTVIKEALLLCLIGVPLGILSGCAGIGITLFLVSDNFSMILNKLLTDTLVSDLKISLYISPLALSIAAAIGVVTALVSAYIPARRAVRITPLEAVRQSADIKIKRSKRRKKYRLTQKLFGFEGMLAAKNFSRNKKRYRAAVMSMFMSIVLFISASSFCDYLTGAVKTISSDVGYDIRVSMMGSNDYDFLLNLESVKKSAYCENSNYDVYLPDDILEDNYKNVFTGKTVETVSILFVDNENYNKLVKENKLLQNAGAVVINQYKHYDENGKVTVFPVVNEKNLTGKVTISIPKKVDGYYYSHFNGETFCYYEDNNSNIQDMKELTFDEAITNVSMNIAGYIDQKPYYVENNGIVAIFPVSLMPEELSVNKAFILTDDFAACEKELDTEFTQRGIGYSIYNNAEENATNRALATVINVFSYGFIILISLIAIANVFNTITTNINLRRRELAMIKSVGITKRGERKMMNYECVICGMRSLVSGLPVAVLVTFWIYLAANEGFGTDFYIPWQSIAIAVFSVFVVIFSAMLYSMKKLSKENIIETLRKENI